MPQLLAAGLVGLVLASPVLGANNDGGRIAKTNCASCHGTDGNTPDAHYPTLAGQVSGFLELQLKNYRSGERPHPIMAAIAKPLTDREIAAVSSYYATLPPMRYTGRVDTALAARGEVIFNQGKPGAPACRLCHGARGEGLAPVFARVAGQHPEFVVEALQPYRKAPRFGNPYAYVMKAVVQELSDSDIEAVAAYVATLSK